MKIAIAVVVWFALGAGGVVALGVHSATPGAGAEAPARLDAGELRAPGRSALVMIAHPACPCTRASLQELEILALQKGDDLDMIVLFSGAIEHDRVGEGMRAKAAAIRGVRIVEDRHGAMARKFGAHTSGTTLFYDANGELRFAGGITAARGHEGPSKGGDALLALVRGESPGHTSSPVFGCALASE